MRLRRFFGLLSVSTALAFVFALTGCGSATSPPVSSGTSPAPSATKSPVSPSAKPVVLFFTQPG